MEVEVGYDSPALRKESDRPGPGEEGEAENPTGSSESRLLSFLVSSSHMTDKLTGPK